MKICENCGRGGTGAKECAYCIRTFSPSRGVFGDPDQWIPKKTDVKRISKKAYYLTIAESVAARSTCLRRKYGAVIVRDDEIIATGYNGAPRGEPNCCDVGACWREENAIPHGERYEACRSVHAEMNAIVSASRREMIGATLFLVGLEDGKRIEAHPCDICRRLIVNAGIYEVVTYG